MAIREDLAGQPRAKDGTRGQGQDEADSACEAGDDGSGGQDGAPMWYVEATIGSAGRGLARFCRYGAYADESSEV